MDLLLSVGPTPHQITRSKINLETHHTWPWEVLFLKIPPAKVLFVGEKQQRQVFFSAIISMYFLPESQICVYNYVKVYKCTHKALHSVTFLYVSKNTIWLCEHPFAGSVHYFTLLPALVLREHQEIQQTWGWGWWLSVYCGHHWDAGIQTPRTGQQDVAPCPPYCVRPLRA